MKFGLEEQDYHFLKKQLTAAGEFNAKIYCFGSRARGDYHEFSDLDLMLESDKDLSDLIGELREVFEESSLPIKIDLVQLKDFEKSYLENYLKEKTLF